MSFITKLSIKAYMLCCLLAHFTDVHGQSPAFSLVVNDHTQHVENTLQDETITFFTHHPVRPDITLYMPDTFNSWYDGAKKLEIPTFFTNQTKFPRNAYIIRISFDPANEIDLDAIRLTLSVWDLRHNQTDFTPVDVLYTYNDESVNQTILPLLLSHVSDIICGSGKKTNILYLKTNDECVQKCFSYKEIFVQLFKKADFYKSFCLMGSKDEHRGGVLGEYETKNEKKMVRFYYQGQRRGAAQFEADCHCDLDSIQADMLDFVHKIVSP